MNRIYRLYTVKDKLIDYIRNLSVYKKILIMHSTLLGILLIISLICIQSILSIYDTKLYQMSIKELGYYINTVDAQLKGIEQISYEIALDYDIQKQLNEIMSIQDEENYQFNMNNFRSRIMQASLNADTVTYIIYTDRENTVYGNGKRYVDIPEELYQEILNQCEQAQGAYVSIPPTEEFPYLLSGRDIRYFIDESLDYLGTLILISDLSELIETSKGVLELNDTELFILSESNVIYGENDIVDKVFGNMYEEKGYDIVNIKGEKYFVCYDTSNQNGWRYFTVSKYSDRFYVISMLRYMVIAGFCILFGIGVFGVRQVAKYITFPLKSLTYAMSIAENGDFNKAKEYIGDKDSEDELGILQREFKMMLDKIDWLIKENYEKQLLIKDTRYRALQAQINPHFLYNTLNSVNWMIRALRTEEAGKMVISLGELLHQVFNNEPMTTVREEVELLENYIYIQKIRYQDRGKFILEKSPEVSDMIIPRMILQPIIENAVYYGIDQSIKMCIIHITIQTNREWLTMTISDDGPGMEPVLLERVKKFCMKARGNGIGLKNIDDRLKLLYKGNYLFEIESEVGIGTKVTIRIPNAVKSTEDNSKGEV